MILDPEVIYGSVNSETRCVIFGKMLPLKIGANYDLTLEN
jgi:hypothetical protein